MSPPRNTARYLMQASSMSFPRQIQFEGDDASYVRFLEAKVFELESSLHCAFQQRSHPPTVQSVVTRASSRDSHDHNCPDEAGNQSADLQVIEYNPSQVSSATGKRIFNGQTRARWQSNLDLFLAKIPSLDHWRSQEPELSRQSRITLKILVQGDASSHEKTKASSPMSSESVSIIPILSQYCDFTMNMSPEGDFYRKLACFHELVFMSFCAVALKTVDDADSVFEVMRSYSGSEAQEKHLIKLVRGAIWANRSIFALSKTSWGSAGSSAFLVARQPISYYARYAESSESLPYLLGRMSTKTGDRPDDGEVVTSTPLAIPLIIEKLARGSISLPQICECLGYEMQYVESCRSPFELALAPSSKRKRGKRITHSSSSKRQCLHRSQPTLVPSSPIHIMGVVDQLGNEKIVNPGNMNMAVNSSSPAQSTAQPAFSPNAGNCSLTQADFQLSRGLLNNLECSSGIAAGSFSPGQGPQELGIPAVFENQHIKNPPLQSLLGDRNSLSLSSMSDPDFPDLTGDPFANADFPDLTGDPFANADFPDLTGDPFANADFPDLTGDPFTNADFPDLVNNFYMNGFCGSMVDPPVHENLGRSNVNPEVC